MPVKQVKQALGSFQVTLYPTVPREILDQLHYLGHIAVIEGKINPSEYNDEILDAAKYVGVYRNRVNDVDNRTYNVEGSYILHGVSMAFWLGDEDGKGSVIETPLTFTGETFANTVRALLPASVAEGTLHTIAGTYSSKHAWESPRKAIDYVTTTFGAEWRVNNDATLDAGTVAQLYSATPTGMLVKNDYGRDLTLAAYEGKIDSAEDIEDFTTRVVILAEGEGESIATGSANIAGGLNPYKDLFGGTVNLTRVISESTTTSGNANARAAIALGEYDTTRRSIRLATRDFSVTGTLNIGEYIYVYDPDTGLVDTANEVYFRGTRINPVKFRCVEIQWPVIDGMTVAYRSRTGTWIDLTPWVNFEGGDVAITIGDLPRSLTGGWGEPIGTRPSDDGSIPSAPVWNTPFFTSSYLDGMGNTRARVLLSWDLPLNTDGSTILDGDHYEIEYGINPAAEWQSNWVAWGSLETLISDLGPGLDYDIRIRAVDKYNHTSAWSVTEQITVSPDTIAPSTPAAPVVAGSLIAIQVVHSLGKNSGGTFNLEHDLDHLDIHLGTINTFTPDSTTLIGKLPANYGMIQGGISAIATFPTSETALRWVKVIAVDEAGNASTPSPAASVTAVLIDDAHISDLTVSKVTAGTINVAWLLAGSIRTATTGQRVSMDGTNGILMYNASNTLLVWISTSGYFFLRSATSGARIDISTVTGIELYNSGGIRTVSLDTDGSFELRSAASGARIQLDGSGFRAYNSSGIQTVDISASTGNAMIIGELQSGPSGRRLVVSPSSATDPEIRFYEDNGVNYSKICQPPRFNNETDLVLQSSNQWANYTRLILNDGAFTLSYGDANVVAGSYIVGIQSQLTLNVPGNSEILLHAGGTIIWGDQVSINANNGGELYLFGNPVRVEGSLWVNSNPKTFIIDHPDDPDRYLIHATTESPNVGVEYWGDITLGRDGRATVDLPDYFESLTLFEGRSVMITSCGELDYGSRGSATYPENGSFKIFGLANQRVFWLVKAVRSDCPPLLVEPLRSEVDIQGDGPYKYNARG